MEAKVFKGFGRLVACIIEIESAEKKEWINMQKKKQRQQKTMIDTDTDEPMAVDDLISGDDDEIMVILPHNSMLMLK